MTAKRLRSVRVTEVAQQDFASQLGAPAGKGCAATASLHTFCTVSWYFRHGGL